MNTKLNPPKNVSDVLERKRLQDKMDAGLRGKLTLISAPAGFGKTTLVCSWLASKNILSTWFSLDEGDNDINRFFRYLIAALQKIKPSIGEKLKDRLGEAKSVEYQQVMELLLNDLASMDSSFTLILDDYHLITNSQIHSILSTFLKYQYGNIHLIVISRTDPPLPLSKLRVRRQITEIRSSDLRFTLEEAIFFFNKTMKLDLAVKDIQSLEHRTEGWIASLQLAALSLQNHSDKKLFVQSFTGSHRYIIDYLVDEVLYGQPEYVQNFLCKTSILDSFNASLCDFILEKDQSHLASYEILQRIEKENLFLIPLDDEREWYRYHHLFREFLVKRLKMNHKNYIPHLYKKASLWYEMHDMIDEAIQCAIKGEDWGGAAKLLEKLSCHLFFEDDQDHNEKLIQFVQKIPDAILKKHHVLCMAYLWTDLISSLPNFQDLFSILEPISQFKFQLTVLRGMKSYLGFKSDATVLFEGALKLYSENTSNKYLKKLNRYTRDICLNYLALCYIYTGNLALADEFLGKSLDTLQQSGNTLDFNTALWYAISLKINRGKLHEAQKTLLFRKNFLLMPTCDVDQFYKTQHFIRINKIIVKPIHFSSIFLAMAMLNYEWNYLDKVETNLKQVAELSKETGGTGNKWTGFKFLIYYYVCEKNLIKALDLLDELDALRFTIPNEKIIITVVALAMELRLFIYQKYPQKSDLLQDVSSWITADKFDVEDEFDYFHEREYKVYLRYLIIKHEIDKAWILCDKLIAKAQESGRVGHLIQYLLLGAIIQQKKEQFHIAINYLKDAIKLAEPQGYIRTFIDEGSPIYSLLKTLKEKDVLSDYVHTLLAAFAKEIDANPTIESSILDERFKEREVHILIYLEKGFTYREIADKLFLSLNTIKWYGKRIYSKLGVQNRTQAVLRAKELKILQ